jgi:hypothetical protein
MIINASKLYDLQPITGVNIKYCIYESTGEGEGDASGGDAGDASGDASGGGEGEGSCEINGTYELVVESDDQYTDGDDQYSIIVSVSSFTLENNNNYSDIIENTNFNDTLIETNTEDDFTYWKDIGLIRKNLDFPNIEATITIYKDYNRDTYPVGFDYLYYNQEDCTFRSYYNNYNYYFRKTS